MYDQSRVQDNIKKIHSNDQAQMNIIFDNDKRIIVEAPAGCGKTKTLISKIAYMISSNQLESTKKIMALTFSVNASYKIKKDVFEQLPMMLECTESESLELTDKIYVSNYHGFCRRILSLYGYLLFGKNINIKNMLIVDDYNTQEMIKSQEIDPSIADFFNEFGSYVKENNQIQIDSNIKKYNEMILQYCFPKNIMTFNSIITLAFEILVRFDNVRNFYKQYFPVIFVDEFQDTNYLSWLLLKSIIGIETKAIFMGDPLQRIYGFIGALPDLMIKAEKELLMKKYTLNTNYRFKDNTEMLLLDKNIRMNAEVINNDNIVDSSNPDIIVTETQKDEAEWICNKVIELSKDEKVAVLVRAGIINKNTQAIRDALDSRGIKYFFALFSDEDADYIKFHEICDEVFSRIIEDKKVVTKKVLDLFVNKIDLRYGIKTAIEESLLKLLSIFCDRILLENTYLSQEEKINYIKDSFQNRGLRQNMDKIDEKIILATIHACKGLEYPYVIITDNEKDSFPSYYGCCKDCYKQNKDNRCVKTILTQNEVHNYYEELSVFYVGFTRARKKVFFTMSHNRLNADGNQAPTIGSCFLKLKGIGRNNLDVLKK